MSFSRLDLSSALLGAITELGYTVPTAIQQDVIPPALAGRDVLGCAETGSGKTAAFLVPIIQRLAGKPRGTTRALVLVPTRELASQVYEAFVALSRHSRLAGAVIFGGVDARPQEQALRRGVDVVIATPGRLLDLLGKLPTRLRELECLVLDEADRMLDMGFLPDIRKVLQHVPVRRQTLFFSATMPQAIRTLTRELMSDPLHIGRERVSVTPTGITQAAYPVAQDLKSKLLVELLKRGVLEQALVFTRTKHRANRLADVLVQNGIQASRIHGNRSQAQRELALRDFKNGKCPVLVATDIVARGIDVEALQHVVNFDVPIVPDDYVHRVGRTGRAEATGEAFTLVAPDERASLLAIERVLGRTLPRVTLPDFDYAARAGTLEVPLAQRIAEIRARKAAERARSAARGKTSSAPGRRPHAAGAGGARRRAEAGAAARPSAAPRQGRFRPRRRRPE